jgi:hypothetical protein
MEEVAFNKLTTMLACFAVLNVFPAGVEPNDAGWKK